MFLQPIPKSLPQGSRRPGKRRLLASQVCKGTLRSFATCLSIADNDYKSIVERRSHKLSQQTFEASATVAAA